VTIVLRTFGQAAYLSLHEFFQVYSVVGYIVSWIPRVVIQLAFYYWLGGFVGGSDLRAFMVIGFSAQMCAHATLVFATQGVGRELAVGTMVLMIATPARPIVVLLGRSLAMAGNGLVTAALGLAVALPVLGIDVDAGRLLGALPVLFVIALTSYGMAMLLASVMLRYPEYQNGASNLVGFVLIVVGGVTVPVEVLPGPLQVISYALPFTYGLEALRALLAGADPAEIVRPLALAVAGGAAYFALASLSFAHFLDRARARGTLDFH
jgi:ABC-2 type transport system permease protein